jgi:hypothetical protein
MANPQSDDIAATGWLVSVTPTLSDKTYSVRLVAAAFETGSAAEFAVMATREGSGCHVIALRRFTAGEMMLLRLKPGDIKPHD